MASISNTPKGGMPKSRMPGVPTNARPPGRGTPAKLPPSNGKPPAIGRPIARAPGGPAGGYGTKPGKPGKPVSGTAVGNGLNTTVPGTRGVIPAKPPGAAAPKSRMPGVKTPPGGSNGKRLPGKPGVGGGPGRSTPLPPMGGRGNRGM